MEKLFVEMKLYLDNAATTQVHPSVLKVVNEFMVRKFGNASSPHSVGKEVRNAIEDVREKIARKINCESDEIVFTSGGTESNNLALKGLSLANKGKKHIITSVIEHPSILEVCKDLEKGGFEVSYIGVDSDGFLDLDDLKKKIRKDTLIVSVMHVNNEIGVIQNLEEIGKVCKSKGVYFHSDCVQSFGKIKIDVRKMNLDFISVSGHKLNAPKGVGFLYVKKGVEIKPLLLGGGHENNLRSGTENSTGIIGLGEALNLKRDEKEVKKIRDYMIKEILKIRGCMLNGSKEKRIYNNINVSFYGIEGEGLLLMLDKKGIYVSTGSACSSHKLSHSHVLKAIKVPMLYINGSLRLTLLTTKALTKQEADYVINEIKKGVEKLRKISPFKFKKDVTKD